MDIAEEKFRTTTKMDTKIVAHALSKTIWQISRYGFATSVTVLALAILPIVIWLIIAVIGGIIVLVITFMLFISGVTASADPPIMALILAVLFPIAYILALLATLIGILVIDFLFTVLIILPTSILTDITLHYLPSRQAILKIARFGLGGFMVGSMVSGIWLAFNLQNDWFVVGMQIGLIMLLCTLATGLFGFTLIMTDKTRSLLGTIAARLFNQPSHTN